MMKLGGAVLLTAIGRCRLPRALIMIVSKSTKVIKMRISVLKLS